MNIFFEAAQVANTTEAVKIRLAMFKFFCRRPAWNFPGMFFVIGWNENFVIDIDYFEAGSSRKHYWGWITNIAGFVQPFLSTTWEISGKFLGRNEEFDWIINLFFEAEPSLETLLRLYRSGLVLFNHFLTAWELSQNVPGCGEEVVWALNHLVEDGPSRKMNTIEALRMRTQLNCLCGSHGLAALTWYSS